MSINNGDHTIRLLNIDTPETKDPNQPVECLGPQAADYLAQQLPPGTAVRLEFDAERHDRYGRTLAGVFAPNGTLVNAEIAREGLGIPVHYGTNVKFLPPVEAAYEEARAAKTGLFSDQIDCTLPTQLAETTKTLDAAAAAAAAPETTSAAAGTAFAVLVTELAAGALRAVLAASKDTQRAVYWAGLSAAATAGSLAMLDKKISSAEKKRDKTKALQATLAAAEKRAEEERVAAEERAAAEKKAADEAAAAAEAAAEEEDRLAAIEAERQRNLPAPYVPPAPRPYVPPAQAPYVPPANPKYIGPRCYAPGGKTYRPC